MSSLDSKLQKKQDSSERIIELRKKIMDKKYVDNAVQRIALVLSRNLVEKPQGVKEAINGTR